MPEPVPTPRPSEPLPPITPEQVRREFAAIQDENGVDLTLIRANLMRTPLERLRWAEQGYLDAMRIRRLARRITDNAA